ncbi:MAG: protein kinase [Spirochaetia bacterium]|jgi:serine/threonine protein kinase|nr:protein kinase [Spirochaetia bacterium]
MQQGDVLQSCYVLEERIGKSPYAETWAAVTNEACVTAQAGLPVVVKILSLGDMPEWKGYDHFEKETAALKAMRHPAVPKYIDSFRHDGDDSQGSEHRLCLVMERVPGRSIAAELEAGRRWTEPEIELMFAEILSILAYLQALRPPIIHRDINPKNLILKPDGSIALVDFSGVQDAVRLAYRDTATMLGSAGYAPLEQISGRATVRSDLYATAATVAQLLTLTHPSDLPMKGLRLDPAALVDLSPRLAFVLDNYLQPDESLRNLPIDLAVEVLRGSRPVPSSVPSSASRTGKSQTGREGARPHSWRGKGAWGNWKESAEGQDPDRWSSGSRLDNALARLADLAAERMEEASEEGSGPEEYDNGHEGDDAGQLALPADSKVVLEADNETFHLSIPRSNFLSPSFLAGGFFAVIWLGFVAFWTFMAIAMGAPLFFPLFSLPFWAVGIFLVKALLQPALTSIDLIMTREGGVLLTEVFAKKKVRHWPLSDLGNCSVKRSAVTQNGRADMELALELGTKTIRFGKALSPRERKVIARTINVWRKS